MVEIRVVSSEVPVRIRLAAHRLYVRRVAEEADAIGSNPIGREVVRVRFSPCRLTGAWWKQVYTESLNLSASGLMGSSPIVPTKGRVYVSQAN